MAVLRIPVMAKEAPAADGAVKLLRNAGVGGLVIGAITLITIVGGIAFDAPVPPPLHHANLAMALLQLGLGAGVAARKRAPWAFLVSTTAVISLVNLLGLPELLRAKDAVAIAIAALCSVELVLLLLGTSAVKSGDAEAAQV